jgi:hypothetical protein
MLFCPSYENFIIIAIAVATTDVSSKIVTLYSTVIS